MAEKVAINESIVENDVRTFEWNGYTIEVKRFLPVEDAMGYIDDVVAGCIDENGDYYPAVLDFERRRELIRRYTNIEMPEDIAAEYKILYGTNLCDAVYEVIDPDQLDTLWSAINEHINLIKYDRRSAAEKQMADIYAMMKSLANVLNETVGEVDGEQFEDFIKVLSNANIDENKIVSALLDERKKRDHKLVEKRG